MAGGQDEAVAVEPVRVLWVVAHDLVVEDVAHWGAAHGETGVAGVGLFDGVDREEADRVDRLLDERGLRRLVQSLHGGGPDGAAGGAAAREARGPRRCG